jgi:aryl-alcohol dehydrogenase-like predicted oxidoreductase
MLMGGATPAEAHRILDRFLEAGSTLIDTADVYGDGESERTLAPWLTRHRDRAVLATKVRFAVSDPGGEGLAPDRIRAACDASLRRLGVDVIDLIRCTHPTRESRLKHLGRAGRTNPSRESVGAGRLELRAWLLAWSVSTQDREGWVFNST